MKDEWQIVEMTRGPLDSSSSVFECVASFLMVDILWYRVSQHFYSALRNFSTMTSRLDKKLSASLLNRAFVVGDKVAASRIAIVYLVHINLFYDFIFYD